MSLGQAYFNPKLLGETAILTWNWASKIIDPAVTISTAVITSTVYSGTDASPSSMISGSATISGYNVTQKITGGVLGVVYQLLCTITTSDGQTLQMPGFLAVVPNVV